MMEQAFEKLQKAGKNNADELVNWMKDAKVVDSTKEAMDKAKSYFGSEQNNVSFAKFKEVVEKLATEQKKTLEDVSKSLVTAGNTLVDKLMAGASALKDKLF